tara:strand:+ start:3440 stop:4309 length:870 start_codon:yes stop_codon:yes gene_type:complete
MEVAQIKYVPIDFIKTAVIGMTPDHFHNNPLLTNPKSIFDSEILTKTIYSHKNLSIKIFENNNRIEFSGSLHTFYNNGMHNYNDFNSKAFIIALNSLYLDLGIKPQNLYIIHLEWGYNIKPPVKTNYILDRLLQHKSVNKTVGIDCKIEGKYSQFKHSAKILKIYNKGMHFKIGYEMLRVEIKQINWSEYRLKGITTLQDFIKADKTLFVDELLHQWKRTILYDIQDTLEPKNLQYQTAIFWDELRENKSNKTFKYHFDKLNKLNESIGRNTKNKIIDLIIKKSNELQL